MRARFTGVLSLLTGAGRFTVLGAWTRVTYADAGEGESPHNFSLSHSSIYCSKAEVGEILVLTGLKCSITHCLRVGISRASNSFERVESSLCFAMNAAIILTWLA